MDDPNGQEVTTAFNLLKIPYELDKVKDVQVIQVSDEREATSAVSNDSTEGFYYILIRGDVVPLDRWAPRECKHTYHKPADIY
jgi:hypothetical protein